MAWDWGIFILTVILNDPSHQVRLGTLPTRDCWQKVEGRGDNVLVFCIVLLHGLTPCGKSPCVISLFPYSKCQDRSCFPIICSPWTLLPWLSDLTGFPSCLDLLYFCPPCLTQLISPAAALFFFFLFPSHLSNGCFISLQPLFSQHTFFRWKESAFYPYYFMKGTLEQFFLYLRCVLLVTEYSSKTLAVLNYLHFHVT